MSQLFDANVEKEIDYRIQLAGVHLGTESPEHRIRIARQIEMEKARRKAMPEREIPTFKLPRS